MKNQNRFLRNFTPILIGVLGSIGSIASIMSASSELVKVISLCVLIVFLSVYVPWWIFLNRRRANLGSELIRNGKNDIDWDKYNYHFEYVELEGEIARICEFEGIFLDNEDFPPHKVAAMWKRYKKGIIYCNDPSTGEVAAVFGFWPISAKTLEDLVDGKLDEKHIESSDILKTSGGKNWWIGFIGATPMFRKNNPAIAAAIITWAFADWLPTQEADREIKIVAGAWTKQGERHLKYLAFAQLRSEEDSIYLFKGKISTLVERLSKIRVRFVNNNLP